MKLVTQSPIMPCAYHDIRVIAYSQTDRFLGCLILLRGLQFQLEAGRAAGKALATAARGQVAEQKRMSAQGKAGLEAGALKHPASPCRADRTGRGGRVICQAMLTTIDRCSGVNDMMQSVQTVICRLRQVGVSRSFLRTGTPASAMVAGGALPGLMADTRGRHETRCPVAVLPLPDRLTLILPQPRPRAPG